MVIMLCTLSTYPDRMPTPKHVKTNLSKHEKTALQELINDNIIIIKEADKAGATIIMDKIFYKNKIEELLSDTDNDVLVKGGNHYHLPTVSVILWI